ncbi:hypothetical protein QVD17_31681 [Tagetes erecta]|uniref:Uncharacterized protein n=1 Tax=Tagetes erecta TaxID=13708 RepID=A0AAD8NPJ3_TARER|nr:hypothetical protein QVD17_31681 [Tagetes erecta]
MTLAGGGSCESCSSSDVVVVVEDGGGRVFLITWTAYVTTIVIPNHAAATTTIFCNQHHVPPSRYNKNLVSTVEDRFMSIKLPYGRQVSESTKSITMQLPHDWYRKFSGILFCTYNYDRHLSIFIKRERSMDSEPHNDYWEEFEKNQDFYEYSQVGYVPFGSLRHIPWWNYTYTKKITFEIEGRFDFKVGLVPRKSKFSDSMETSNASIIDSSDLWDEEYWEDNRYGKKTFEIKYDSRSSNIQIEWDPGYIRTRT